MFGVLRIGRRLPALVIASLLIITVAGCGSGLTGTYTDEMGIVEYQFKPNGTARMNTMGTVMELEYTIDGNELHLEMMGGVSQILRIEGDGEALVGPMGMTLSRQSD